MLHAAAPRCQFSPQLQTAFVEFVFSSESFSLDLDFIHDSSQARQRQQKHQRGQCYPPLNLHQRRALEELHHPSPVVQVNIELVLQAATQPGNILTDAMEAKAVVQVHSRDWQTLSYITVHGRI
ncbi:hypothetical protein ABZP36_028248 [Zizania latifolia]